MADQVPRPFTLKEVQALDLKTLLKRRDAAWDDFQADSGSYGAMCDWEMMDDLLRETMQRLKLTVEKFVTVTDEDVVRALVASSWGPAAASTMVRVDSTEASDVRKALQSFVALRRAEK